MSFLSKQYGNTIMIFEKIDRYQNRLSFFEKRIR